jgi:hypothetical protein
MLNSTKTYCILSVFMVSYIQKVRGNKMSKQKKQPKPVEERNLWNGFRPSVIPARKKNKRLVRESNKQLCRDVMKGGDY